MMDTHDIIAHLATDVRTWPEAARAIRDLDARLSAAEEVVEAVLNTPHGTNHCEVVAIARRYEEGR